MHELLVLIFFELTLTESQRQFRLLYSYRRQDPTSISSNNQWISYLTPRISEVLFNGKQPKLLWKIDFYGFFVVVFLRTGPCMFTCATAIVVMMIIIIIIIISSFHNINKANLTGDQLTASPYLVIWHAVMWSPALWNSVIICIYLYFE